MKSADRQRYEKLTARMMTCQPGNGAFMDAWRELEEIKNRHGGMPPEEFPDAQTKPAGPASPEETQAVGRGDDPGQPAGPKAHNCGQATCGSAGAI